ncbi:hypothetical protein PROFUN_12161 [Planoprotostelium fungivorum]|uniref:Mis18 domain-containing protein n=1 Tax=Planoprotostelium fungivorum TaxID=1890364 RepID=A0A2P6N8D0_9EUKA|nr:hypothetical protein PROFUN_12161 [Planoprotostelium fungivorum]
MTQQQQEDPYEGKVLVFQCRACFNIVGDSTFWVTSHRDLRTISLSRATQVEIIEQAIETSKAGVDEGCTYRIFRCAYDACHILLGRKYITTTASLDLMRDVWSFSADAVVTYIVGSAETPISEGLDCQAQIRRLYDVQMMVLQTKADTTEEIQRIDEEVQQIGRRLVSLEGLMKKYLQKEGARSEIQNNGVNHSEGQRHAWKAIQE